MILDIIGTTSGAETDFLSIESVIMKPREVDQGQRAHPEIIDSKNLIETLGKECCRTQKPPKIAGPSAKQGNQLNRRSYRRWTTPEEKIGAGTVPHVPTRTVHVDLA